MSPYGHSLYRALRVAVPSRKDTERTDSAMAAAASDCKVLVAAVLIHEWHWRTNSWYSQLPKRFFGWSIWYSARHHATSGLLLRGTKLCSLMFGWEQHAQCQTALVVRSVITVRGCLIVALSKVISRHATTLSFALLLNLRSQYPRANLKQLSLSLWERGTMSKSHHLTD